MRRIVTLVAALALVGGAVLAQQPNTPTATLLVNGSSGAVSAPVRGFVAVTITGNPFSRFILIFGNPRPVPLATPFGTVDITVNDLLLNGFANPAINTGATGSVTYNFELPAVTPAGLQGSLQAFVEDLGAPNFARLSGATTITAAPSGVTSQFLFFVPILGANGTLPVLPEAGTMPGDMPEMDPIGEVGFTQIYDPVYGNPVYTTFGGPFVCASCHQTPNVWDAYMGTMMANAGRDPIFLSAFSIACDDMDFLQANNLSHVGKEAVADLCIRCHSPTAWHGGRAGVEGDGVTDAYKMSVFDETLSLDREGIVCEVCHRAQTYTPTIAPGFSLDPARPENGQLVYTHTTTKLGPFPGTLQTTYLGGTTAYGALIPGHIENNAPAVPDIPPGTGSAVSPAHGTEQGTFIRDAHLCGSCHNVTNPLNGVGEQRTFTEWERSDYGNPLSPDYKTCQECHMQETPGFSQACNLLGLDPTYGQYAKQRQDLPRHRFAGANGWVPQLFKILYPNVDAPWTNGQNFTTGGFTIPASRNSKWDDVTNEVQGTLARAAEVNLAAGEPVAGTISAQVTIENKTGHKLPTGYPEGRRMWIQLQAFDANDTPFFQTGMLDLNGELIHDANLKVYEMLMGMDYPSLGINRQESFHLVLNNTIIKDNRILPKGMVQLPGIRGADSFDPVTAPFGGLYPNGHSIDTTNYSIAVPPGTQRPIKVKATVFHQISSFSYVDFLANGGDATNSTLPHPIAQTVRSLWLTGNRAPGYSVGYIGPTSTPDPSTPNATAMVVIP